MTHTLGRIALASLVPLFAVTISPTRAQEGKDPVKEPPRADKVDVQIRYRIRADRDERVRQFRALEKFLADLKFDDARKNDPDRERDELDPNAERLSGTVAGADVLKILNQVRVQNILFAPAGFKIPDQDKAVAIRIGLRTGLTGTVEEELNGRPVRRLAQQVLHGQTVAHLGQIGFVEALAYDTKGYTIVRGSLPYKNLERLMKDVRYEPSGWFLSATPVDTLPHPLSEQNPVRWVEVLRLADESDVPFLAPGQVLGVQSKFSADLRTAFPALKDGELRVEVLFRNRLDDLDALRSFIQGRYPGVSLDGIVGNVASVRLKKGSYAENIATETAVIGVRLPRQGSETVIPVAADRGVLVPQALKDARLDELHGAGYTGAPGCLTFGTASPQVYVPGAKVILIGTDFTGAPELIEKNVLPKNTKIVDLTTELSPQLLPAKADDKRAKTGTAAAQVLSAAAPGAELILVRVDPGCFFQLYAVARLARGDINFTDALRVRIVELADQSAIVEADKKSAIEEYKQAFANQAGEVGLPKDKDGKVIPKGDPVVDPNSPDSAIAERRKKAKAALDAVYVREKSLNDLVERFNTYQKQLTLLNGAQVIVNTLVWESGYPLDALNDFAGSLDRTAAPRGTRIEKGVRPQKRSPLWVQASSAAGAAVWGGRFVDSNQDGLMEFAAKPPADGWSPQLNFLGTEAASGELKRGLEKGAKLRLVVQWREPTLNLPGGEDPVHSLTLRLLRQIDPAGEKRASDEMKEVARSVVVPNVVYSAGTYRVFEQILEYEVPEAGHFALAIESTSLNAAPIPALRRDVEIVPRVVVETRDVKVGSPRAVFRSFPNFTSGVGTPGDSIGAITVGVPVTGAQTTGGPGAQLRAKPDVYAPVAFALGGESFGGEGMAAAFTGGVATLVQQAGVSGPNVFTTAGLETGAKLELPATWLRNVRKLEKCKP